MPPVSNKRILFQEFLQVKHGEHDGRAEKTRTQSHVYFPGQTTTFDGSQTIDVENVPLNGGILLKTLVLSLEPFILARMIPGAPVGYKVGETSVFFPSLVRLPGYGVGVVVRSEDPSFQVGDHLYGMYPFAEYSVQTKAEDFNKIDNEHNLPWSVFIGIAGMPGQTAYSGWKEYARAKKGEVAFVTSGAGAVGSLVIQLAKRDGLKVIASAGTDDKVQFLKELGADVAFNYKTTKTAEVLAREGPIDVYWDNVGGETLDVALNAAATYARFIECGMISGYSGDSFPIRNIMNVLMKAISMNGFHVPSLFPRYSETFKEDIPTLLASKELIHREDVTKGLENAEVAFDNFLKGAFIGKSIVVVADE